MLAGEELEKTRAKTAAERAEKSLKSPRGKRITPIAQTTQVSSNTVFVYVSIVEARITMGEGGSAYGQKEKLFLS